MKKIGITGSLASGKTTASKFLSYKRGPLFSADNVVKKFYRSNTFKNKVKKKFRLENTINLKKKYKLKYLQDNGVLDKNVDKYLIKSSNVKIIGQEIITLIGASDTFRELFLELNEVKL